MGHQVHPATKELREELQRLGLLPPDPEPSAGTRQEAGARQAIRSRPLVVALVLTALGGGGWALDAPGAISNLVHKEPKLSIEEASKALVQTPEFVLLRGKLESVIQKQDVMDSKLDVLVKADARREGREDALREERRNR